LAQAAWGGGGVTIPGGVKRVDVTWRNMIQNGRRHELVVGFDLIGLSNLSNSITPTKCSAESGKANANQSQ